MQHLTKYVSFSPEIEHMLVIIEFWSQMSLYLLIVYIFMAILGDLLYASFVIRQYQILN
jgi:hypothetical protein